MEFISPYPRSSQSSGVVRHPAAKTFEAIAASKVLDGPRVDSDDIAGHANAAFARMDQLLAEVSLERQSVTAVHVFLHDVLRDVEGFNTIWRSYFGSHTPCRYCIGATLQSGMLVEMNFFAEFPAG